jgi:hypothetical protein
MTRLTLPGRRKAAKAPTPRAPRWTLPLEVPKCPPGWHTAPPDFIGIGAQRAGTTWWYRGIEAQPQVARIKGQRKELHYFNRFWDGDVPADFATTYHQLFPRPEGAISGEWTPRYMHDYWTPGLIRQAAPDARILVILRDPVERYRSGLSHVLRRADEDGVPIKLAEVADAVSRGFYGLQLGRVLDLFPREQILVLQFERCREDPLGEFRRTCLFLGLDAPDELPAVMTRDRQPKAKPELTDEMRGELVAVLADDVRRLAERCPEVDLELWPNFSS